jgi:hypothetical protein
MLIHAAVSREDLVAFVRGEPPGEFQSEPFNAVIEKIDNGPYDVPSGTLVNLPTKRLDRTDRLPNPIETIAANPVGIAADHYE